MVIGWSRAAWDQYIVWQQEDRQVLRRINRLIDAIARDPYSGEGKPEKLRNELTGYWSRRITSEHRLVYLVRGEGDDRMVLIAQCRFHY